MQTHGQLVAKLMRRPGVRKEVERIEREEGELLDILLKACGVFFLAVLSCALLRGSVMEISFA